MTNIYNQIKWHKKKILSEVSDTSNLTIGYYGKGDPTITIVAGIHGDEGPWGSWSIYQFLNRVKGDEVNGSIRIISQANPSAMKANSRVSPLDYLDLNRVFPGDVSGSYTQRLAHLITNTVVEDSDYLIDLHGGGSWCVNAFAFKFQDSEFLAESFNPPFILKAPKKNGTLTRYAYEKGVKVTAIEIGGSCEYESCWAEYLSYGIERCLISCGVIEEKILPMKKQVTIQVEDPQIIRPSRGGIFVPNVSASSVGKVLSKGEILGRLVDPSTMKTYEIFKAPFNETALLLLRPRMVVLEGGEMTYVVSKLTKKRR